MTEFKIVHTDCENDTSISTQEAESLNMAEQQVVDHLNEGFETDWNTIVLFSNDRMRVLQHEHEDLGHTATTTIVAA